MARTNCRPARYLPLPMRPHSFRSSIGIWCSRSTWRHNSTFNGGLSIWRQKRAADELPAHSELRDRLYAPLERLRHHNDAFGELERAAFNVEVHFGDEVARHLREPLRAYNRIAVVTSCRMSHTELPAPGQVSLGMVRWWESIVYASGTKCGDYSEGGSRELDQLSIDMARLRRQSRQPSGAIPMRRPLASSCFRPNL
jgi:hypothetical protein